MKSSEKWKHLCNPHSYQDVEHFRDPWIVLLCHSQAISFSLSPPTTNLILLQISFAFSRLVLLILELQISFAFSRTSNKWNHTISTLYASFSTMFLRPIRVTTYINNLPHFSAKGIQIYCSLSIHSPLHGDLDCLQLW